MKIRMLVQVSGGRGDGTPWPAPGATLDVDDEEGRHLCQARLAVPVAASDAPEKAVPSEDDVETRAPKPRSTRSRS